MIEETKKNPYELHLIFGNKTKQDILLKEQIDEMKENKHVDVVYSLSREQIEGYWQGRINESMLKKWIGNDF